MRLSQMQILRQPLQFDKGDRQIWGRSVVFRPEVLAYGLGHILALTVHRTVIQYPRAATLRIYIRREEGNGGRKRPLKWRNPQDFNLLLSHLQVFCLFWGFFIYFSVFFGLTKCDSPFFLLYFSNIPTDLFS